MRVRHLAFGSLVILAGCGKIFPPGERLIPGTYGPPYGSALKDNRPHHPHNPASSERHSQSDSAESRTYGSHAACHAALVRSIGSHGSKGHWERISSIESVGHYEEAGEVHEQRCTDYTMSLRSWCKGAEGHGGGHGDAHFKKSEEGCGGESTAH